MSVVTLTDYKSGEPVEIDTEHWVLINSSDSLGGTFVIIEGPNAERKQYTVKESSIVVRKKIP